MSLKDLIDESQDNGGDDKEISGLDEMINLNNLYDKFGIESKCPRCGSSDTKKTEYYWRCNNGNCRVITYLSTDYRITREW